MEFKVTPDTLIPRPETELLVETALSVIEKNSESRVLDLGTGSGAVAISIASERPGVKVVATDDSKTALNIARENAQRLNVANVTFVYSDWYESLDASQFELIVSNPPYVKANDPHLENEGLKFEPVSALVSGPDGLDDLKKIIIKAGHHLTQGGWLMVEHGHDQSEQVCVLLQSCGFKKINSIKDLNHNPRVTIAELGTDHV